MKTVRFFPLALLFISAVHAGPVQSFNGPRDAVVAAKQSATPKAIIFLLTQDFSEDTAVVEKILADHLLGYGDEFVIAKCRESAAAEKAMFVDRFKQKLEVLPLVVVTSAAGEVLARAAGTDSDEYEKMVTISRINAGFEKDPAKISSAVQKYQDDEDDELIGDSIFGMRKKDVGTSKVLLTEQRTWTLVDGRTFEAALLEATGQQGTFITPGDERKLLNFNDFSDGDKAFLQALLQ